MTKLFSFIIFWIFSVGSLFAEVYDGRFGWPMQKRPQEVIVCESAGLSFEEQMLLQSLSGLAAKAVNESIWNEMVWINHNNKSYQEWFENTIQGLKILKTKRMSVWELLTYMKSKRLIKGYVLYQTDVSAGALYSRREAMNYSSNVATVYCSLLNGVLIERNLEVLAIKHGLKLLKDATSESIEKCFDMNKEKLCSKSALSVDPRVPNCRDYAITHRLMLYYDTGEFSEKALSWVVPLSPILGWNCGKEDEYTGAISRWGHYNTASNWCWNLPLLSAGAACAKLEQAKELNPVDIKWDDSANYHSFVMSDGDNMQWTMGEFVYNPLYFGNTGKEDIGISWTLCPINLSIISPYTWNKIAQAQNSKTSFVEYGGGYQYPDLFAINRPNRAELLKVFAQRINYHMKILNLKIFGFICKDVNSAAAKQAFQIYADEIEDLSGMLAIQYFPYELGGKTLWVTNKKGVDIPVITAHYCIWNEVNDKRPYCGTPEYVASLINREVIKADKTKENVLLCTMIHAWSDFSKTSKIGKKPQIGFNAGAAANNLLVDNIKNVSLNELIWRIRMKHRPELIP